MPRYLLDTDVISATLRPRPNLEIARRLALVPSEDVFSTAITLGELIFGAARVGRQDLADRIDPISEVVPMLPFDESAARVFGNLKAELERTGQPLAEPDLRIAAIALAADLTLVTGNERHFSRVPSLRVENWLV